MVGAWGRGWFAGGPGGLLVVLLLCGWAAMPAAAQSGSLAVAMLECAQIKPLLERLNCYDRLSRDLDMFDSVIREACGESATGLPEDPALDEVRRRQNLEGVVAALRDGQRANAATAARQLQVVENVQVEGIELTPNWQVDEVRDEAGNRVEVRLSTRAQAPLREDLPRPAFNILCRGGTTLMWLETGMVGDGTSTAVRVTFDGPAEPVVLTLANTANGQAMGLWSGAEQALDPLLAQAAMTVSFMPREAEEMVRIPFDLTGFEEAVEVIRLQCGW